MKRILPIIILLSVFFSPLQGQEKKTGTLSGNVTSSNEGRNGYRFSFPVSGARITFNHIPDSTEASGDSIVVRSNRSGEFVLRNLPLGKGHIRVDDMKKYYPQDIFLDIFEDHAVLMIELERKAEQLKEAVVKADVPPILHRKDTIIYNAAAVSLAEGENAMEILRQMPGVEIKGGKIYVEGKEVKRTYVNGRLIYGNDASSPLNSIDAQEVTNIKSYEELSVEDRLKGAKSGNMDRVLDITTKNPIFSAFDGHILASGGVDENKDAEGQVQPRYQGAISAKLFSEYLLWSVKANANNIGRSNNEFNSIKNPYGALGSYDEKTVADATLTKYWGDRLLGSSVYASYGFVKDYTRSFSNSLSDYFATQDSPARSYADTTSSSSVRGTHRIDLNVNLNSPVLKMLSVLNTFSISNQVNDSYSGSLGRMAGTDFSRRSESGRNDGRNISYQGRLDWRNTTAKSGWNPVVSLSVDVGRDNSGKLTVDTLATSFRRRRLSTDAGGKNWSVNATAGVEKMLINTDTLSLTIWPNVSAGMSRKENKSLSFDYINPDNPAPDAVNTYDYTWNTRDAGAGVALDFSKESNHCFLNLGASLKNLSDQERVPSLSGFSKNYVIPRIEANYLSRFLRAAYSLYGSVPAVEQVRDRIDDRNPLFVQAGNPDLKPSLTHVAQVDYHHQFQSKTIPSFLQLSFRGSLVDNAIVSDSRYYAAATHIDGWGGYDILSGTTFTKYANTSGTYSINANAMYSLRIQRLKMFLQLGAGYAFSERPQYICGNLLRDISHSPSANVQISCRPNKKVRIELYYGLFYINDRNDAGSLLSEKLDHSLRVITGFTIGKYFFINSNINGNIHHYISGGVPDFNYLAFDSCAGVSLMNGRLLLTVSANDILNRSTSYSVSTSADSRVQSWTPTFGRYYMLNLAFRLNKTSRRDVYKGPFVLQDSFGVEIMNQYQGR